MPKPSSPEAARSGRTSVDPDSAASTAPLAPEAGNPGVEGSMGPTPPGNRPGHRDGGREPDQPDLDAFAQRFARPARRARRSDGDDTGAESGEAVTGRPAALLGHLTGSASRALRVPRAIVGTGLALTEASLEASLAVVRMARRQVALPGAGEER